MRLAMTMLRREIEMVLRNHIIAAFPLWSAQEQWELLHRWMYAWTERKGI